MAPIVAPEVDMLTVSKSSVNQRKAILGFAPRIGLSFVDYGDLDRIDSFYLESQKYRDYYRDPYNKLHKPDRFRLHQGKCGIKLDDSVQMLLKPINWVTERQPVVFPTNYTSDMDLDRGVELFGCYDKNSCIRFKR
ncbi:uncharacterized protein LOC115628472 [Scaptodrosophila lebanonensis]|uniref:Uncharacterized protein LOC115628472 n=1 Tax=Drosophila lebanonensis TaxID=7225 RepID=A0A6J2TWD0_DROLE|nr:uncharacterized protein LOC115628472 [Scaptodrosophila lebanonensis]